MVKTRITALTASLVLTLGLFSAIPSIPAQSQTRQDAETIINFCQVAHKRFSSDNGAYFRAGMELIKEEHRPVVALTCAAYGQGYDVAKRKYNVS